MNDEYIDNEEINYVAHVELPLIPEPILPTLAHCDACPVEPGMLCVGRYCHLARRERGYRDPRRHYWLREIPRKSAELDGLPASEMADVRGKLILRVPANAYTGYGQHSTSLAKELERSGIPVAIDPVGDPRDARFLPVDPWVASRVVPHQAGPRLLSMACNGLDGIRPGDIVLTMWESSRLKPEWVANLNRAACVVVPCRWNADFFAESGVTVPIRTIPLGIDTAVYTPSSPPFPAVLDALPVRFGAAGRLAHGGSRKGLEEVIAAFGEAFPADERVTLEIKCWPDCAIDESSDPRIKLVREPLSESQLADWYRSLEVFVSASKSGGWEMQPHQAMACGRPVIGVIAHGHAEYMTEATTFPVEYDEVPVPAGFPIYGGLGNWFVPRRSSLVNRLREAYADPGACRLKGEAASIRAAEFTWERSGKELAGIVREFGLWKDDAKTTRPPSTSRKVASRTATGLEPAVRDAINSCVHRGPEGKLEPTEAERTCCGGAPELTACSAGRGKTPGRVTLRDCVQCKTAEVRSRKILGMTVWNRPVYLQRTLEALSRCEGIKDYLILPSIEPGNDEVRAIIEGIDFAECKPTWNASRLQSHRNTEAMTRACFATGCDYAVFVEEDTLLAPDALIYYSWAAQHYRHDPTVLSITATHKRHEPVPPPSSEHHLVARRAGFRGISWATWRDRFDAFDGTLGEAPGWDGRMEDRYIRDRGMVEIYPLLPRCNHIGLETSAQSRAAFPPEWMMANHDAGWWCGNVDGGVGDGEFREAKFAEATIAET